MGIQASMTNDFDANRIYLEQEQFIDSLQVKECMMCKQILCNCKSKLEIIYNSQRFEQLQNNIDILALADSTSKALLLYAFEKANFNVVTTISMPNESHLLHSFSATSIDNSTNFIKENADLVLLEDPFTSLV